MNSLPVLNFLFDNSPLCESCTELVQYRLLFNYNFYITFCFFQHYLCDLIKPLAKQFDIPFTDESYTSFALTVLNEACSEKTILASKIAVQLLYGKDDLVSTDGLKTSFLTETGIMQSLKLWFDF